MLSENTLSCGGVIDQQFAAENDAAFHVPLSSDRQHLSYDGCLEVRGEIIRTVLCCIVY